MKPIILGALFALLPLASFAAEFIKKTSAHDVETTANRFETAIQKAGATIFARVDHAAGAQSIDSELRPTTMLMFGNPKIGTPAMQANQVSGLDLPLRVVIFEDETGMTQLVYRSPTDFAAAHGLDVDAEYIVRMTGALDKLSNAAISQ